MLISVVDADISYIGETAYLVADVVVEGISHGFIRMTVATADIDFPDEQATLLGLSKIREIEHTNLIQRVSDIFHGTYWPGTHTEWDGLKNWRLRNWDYLEETLSKYFKTGLNCFQTS